MEVGTTVKKTTKHITRRTKVYPPVTKVVDDFFDEISFEEFRDYLFNITADSMFCETSNSSIVNSQRIHILNKTVKFMSDLNSLPKHEDERNIAL